jgi:hypothetical protein
VARNAGLRTPPMDLDTDKIDADVLALLYLTAFKEEKDY